ncbi:MAG: peptide deformylase [Bacteroidia bacterium]|nr:peptide deformylase [Bacteroidia bacterium]
MIYPIYAYGSPGLRKIAEKVDPSYEGLQDIIAGLFETMYSTDGLGLAAPQIGKPIQLFVIDAKPLEKDEPSVKDFKKVCINPDIIEESGEEWSYNEGCLSVPGIREDIKRLSKIRVTYYDENFVFFDEYYEKVKARIIQHEFDHLHGIIFTDHVSALRKHLIKSKLMNITRGNVKVNYKMKFPG